MEDRTYIVRMYPVPSESRSAAVEWWETDQLWRDLQEDATAQMLERTGLLLVKNSYPLDYMPCWYKKFLELQPTSALMKEVEQQIWELMRVQYTRALRAEVVILLRSQNQVLNAKGVQHFSDRFVSKLDTYPFLKIVYAPMIPETFVFVLHNSLEIASEVRCQLFDWLVAYWPDDVPRIFRDYISNCRKENIDWFITQIKEYQTQGHPLFTEAFVNELVILAKQNKRRQKHRRNQHHDWNNPFDNHGPSSGPMSF